MAEPIRRAISEMGYEHPMPVQEEVIPYLLGMGNDVIALAQTGTGKTAAFGLPVLQKVDPANRATQAVILSPTRELCLQIAGDLKDYSRYIDGLHVLAVYGGSSIESQIRSLRKGAQVIVATPGRLIDLMHRGVAHLDAVENVVLDEADEMLNMGFTESIDEILAGVPAERNTLLFSATMGKEIERIAKSYLTDYKKSLSVRATKVPKTSTIFITSSMPRTSTPPSSALSTISPAFTASSFAAPVSKPRKLPTSSFATATMPKPFMATFRKPSATSRCKSSVSTTPSCS